VAASQLADRGFGGDTKQVRRNDLFKKAPGFDSAGNFEPQG